MSLDQLQAVVTIAEEGTIVRAARRLHISQPPLTRKVAALEDELGVRLFAREPRGMALTPAGRAFVGEAAAILAAVRRAAAVAREASPAQGTHSGSAPPESHTCASGVNGSLDEIVT